MKSIWPGTLGNFVSDDSEAAERWGGCSEITRGLAKRGFGDDELRGILGDNWLRSLECAQGQS
jgi:microsomal dipeptidase-like Zn-dependent dipeptidase